uniref:Movement protein n=1 Tax=Macrostomum lignano TaxID=282301 RepID=A0A1I8FFD2_9PLAT
QAEDCWHRHAGRRVLPAVPDSADLEVSDLLRRDDHSYEAASADFSVRDQKALWRFLVPKAAAAPSQQLPSSATVSQLLRSLFHNPSPHIMLHRARHASRRSLKPPRTAGIASIDRELNKARQKYTPFTSASHVINQPPQPQPQLAHPHGHGTDDLANPLWRCDVRDSSHTSRSLAASTPATATADAAAAKTMDTRSPCAVEQQFYTGPAGARSAPVNLTSLRARHPQLMPAAAVRMTAAAASHRRVPAGQRAYQAGSGESRQPNSDPDQPGARAGQPRLLEPKPSQLPSGPHLPPNAVRVLPRMDNVEVGNFSGCWLFRREASSSGRGHERVVRVLKMPSRAGANALRHATSRTTRLLDGAERRDTAIRVQACMESLWTPQSRYRQTAIDSDFENDEARSRLHVESDPSTRVCSAPNQRASQSWSRIRVLLLPGEQESQDQK